jgi:hypothetical protein
VAAGCGGSSRPSRPLAERVCDGAQSAAARLGQPLKARVLNPAAANLECVLRGPGLRVRILSQASGQAYTEFDTETSHQDQVFGPGIHRPGQIPVQTTIPGAVVAVWIPAEREVVATDAQPLHGGAYVTVTVSGRALTGASALAVARAAARSTFAAHPDAGA